MRTAFTLLLVGLALASTGPVRAVDQTTPEVLASFPHDSDAYTQGLLLYQGFFYESTGLYGQSSLRRVDPITGVVVQQTDLAPGEFGEGLARVGQQLIQLTWQENLAYVRDIQSFARLNTFTYGGEGWGLCHDGVRLVMSDGSSFLTFRDPGTFEILGQVQVTSDGVSVGNLNELECVGRLVYANVYLTDTIVRIHADTGVVLTEIDASDLLTPADQAAAGVLNGIAFDPITEHFFLTGKLWPQVFEVGFDFDPYGNGPCEVATLSEVGGVMLERDDADGVRFSWDPDPMASRYHVNSVDSIQHASPPGPHRPDLPGGFGVARCNAVAPQTSCTDPYAALDPEPLLFYQVYSACGPTGAEEGPP